MDGRPFTTLMWSPAFSVVATPKRKHHEHGVKRCVAFNFRIYHYQVGTIISGSGIYKSSCPQQTWPENDLFHQLVSLVSMTCLRNGENLNPAFRWTWSRFQQFFVALIRACQLGTLWHFVALCVGKLGWESLQTIIIWLAVYLPLWKMMEFVSWDDDLPNRWKNKIHVPNHQPVIICWPLLILFNPSIQVSPS